MTDFDPIAERPECAEAQAALQRMLDGEAAWDTPEAAAHRANCMPCREELTLAGSLTIKSDVVLPANLSDRVLRSALSARKRDRLARWAGIGVALAASVAIAIVVIRPSQKPETGPVVQLPPLKPQPPKIPPTPSTPPKPLGETMSEARDAIVAAARRTAEETRDQSAMLVPTPKMPDTPAGTASLEPLADARTGAARSVEPIRNSAIRALDFFVRAADSSKKAE